MAEIDLIKISELPATSTIGDADELAVVQGGATKKVPYSVLKAGAEVTPDTTLSEAGVPADAAAVGAALSLKANQAAVTQALAAKADKTEVAGISGDIAELASVVETKADQTALNQKADKTTTDALRQDLTTLNGIVNQKADKTELNTQIGNVTAELATKADTDTVNAALALKADKTELTAGLASKQNVLTFDSTPTEGSTNPVTSGGVWEAVQTDKTLAVEDKAADAKAVGDAIIDFKYGIVGGDVYDIRKQMNHYSSDWNGIRFDWSGDECSITGTATAVTYNNIFISTNSLPRGINAGDVLRIKYTSKNVSFIIYDYSGGSLKLLAEIKRDAVVKIPETCTGLIVRLWIANGTTVNETVNPQIYINNSYTINAVDTESASEDGKTDMRGIIQDMLKAYKHCKLAAGAYYISDMIDMPEGSTLEGCGESTKVYLMSGERKAAIGLRAYSSVRNMWILGSYADLTESDFGENNGTRYGIRYYKGSSDQWTPAYCTISNVRIANFSAAGIYQYGTGANVEQGLFVSNVSIKNCWCGIWIYSNSEFCRYNNVQITYCRIACINNGGNNAFENCVFHAYLIGMKIDGTQNNSAHGMVSNSSFCHIGNNAGSALKLDSIVHGFVFNANQFWYNSIDIANCGGIVFNGCEFGRGTTGKGATINITGGNTVMFGGCVFMNDATYPPQISISDNSKVKFNNCYGSITGDAISA